MTAGAHTLPIARWGGGGGAVQTLRFIPEVETQLTRFCNEGTPKKTLRIGSWKLKTSICLTLQSQSSDPSPEPPIG
jgi:hypothetical protein